MNKAELAREVDALATRDQEHAGYGYADGQHPWHYDPAIEQPRQPFLDLLELLRGAGLRDTFLQIGLGRHGGSHLAFRLVARRIVSVERDQERLAAFAAAAELVPGRDVLIAGDSSDARVRAEVAAAAGGCDLLFLDGGDTYEQARADWEAYSGLVREGGIVAIADASQACPGDARPFAVDRFVADLERDWLRPRATRAGRLGGAHAIHWYVQGSPSRGRPALPRRAEPVVTARPAHVGRHLGFALHEWKGQFLAVPGPRPELDPRAILRHETALVLAGPSRASVERRVEAWRDAEPRLAEARRKLAGEDAGAAKALVHAVAADHPDLREGLLAGLAQAPLQKPLLQALGTHALFGASPREGVALLRKALDQDLFDRELLLAVANAHLLVLQDRQAAGDLLAEVRRKVRHARVAQACREKLSGNALWRYPQLLQDLRGVIQVGAHCGEEVEAFALLGLERQAYLEPQPEAFARLELQVRAAGGAGATLLNVAAGEKPGPRELRLGTRTERASFLRTHALARVEADDVQARGVSVPVTTLDALVAEGKIDPRHYDLLVVDTEGTELEVLRGALELLKHVDVVCVAVFLDAVYEGAPMPQQVQAFLREVHGGDGFHLRAFEPGPDPARGDAVFRRIKIRRGRR